jgi:UrcA family protein
MRRIYLLCVAALLASAAPAVAQEAQQRVVRYGDLNLDNPHGARVLVRRINQASGDVCNDRTGPRPLTENAIVHACKDEAAENAVADVDHPMVTAEYYGRREPRVIIEDEGAPPEDSDDYNGGR